MEAVATTTAEAVMQVYYVIAMFGILLCTFMLWLSFKANVMHGEAWAATPDAALRLPELLSYYYYY